MKRRRAREMVLKILFQIYVGGLSKEYVMNDFLYTRNIDENSKNFIEDMVENTIKNSNHIDRLIEKYSIDWNIDRLGNVELNVLRFSIYELLYRDDIPPNVTINEAIEITKKYSGIEAAKFVNGILGKINEDFNKNRKGETQHGNIPGD